MLPIPHQIIRTAALPVTAPAVILRGPARALTAALGGAFAIALAATPVAAQDAAAPPAEQPAHAGHHGQAMHGVKHGGTVTAQGQGQASVEPDLAVVSLGVTTQAPTAAQAMSDNAAKQTAVIEALKTKGIASEDLQTQGLNLNPMQDYPEGKAPTVTGYQAQNIVSVRVRDLANLGPLLDEIVTAGATDIQSISFSREDDVAAMDEARTAAVADARRRAEVMAKAAGMELGPLVALSEGGGMSGPMPEMAMRARADSTPIERGQLQLSAQVKGVWRLVPPGGSDQPNDAAE